MLVLSSREEAACPGQSWCLSEDRGTVTPASTPNARSQAGATQGLPRPAEPFAVAEAPTSFADLCPHVLEGEGVRPGKEREPRPQHRQGPQPTHSWVSAGCRCAVWGRSTLAATSSVAARGGQPSLGLASLFPTLRAGDAPVRGWSSISGVPHQLTLLLP